MAANLSALTSRAAIEEAIGECDKLGRDEFLKHYGYKYSRLYPLHVNGKVYDSKAIVGVAFGKQHGTPLKAKEFSGGIATVAPVIYRLLGIQLEEVQNPPMSLVKGATYYRKDLLETYGGQLQKGIWTPKEFPVVFIFTGASGSAYGYRDGWTEDGLFCYTGEGQSGDMSFTTGNAAIRDHRERGKDLLLFEDLGKGKGVRYEGLFECASWEEIDGLDKDKRSRKLIVFNLVPVSSASAGDDAPNGARLKPEDSKSIEELRNAAYAAAKSAKATKRAEATKKSWYERSEKVRSYVLARANGVCEACDEPAPFIRKDGTPYLEPHHTHRLADEGPDHPAWVGAICPTCHRRIHSGKDGIEWNKMLQEKLKKREPN